MFQINNLIFHSEEKLSQIAKKTYPSEIENIVM